MLPLSEPAGSGTTQNSSPAGSRRIHQESTCCTRSAPSVRVGYHRRGQLSIGLRLQGDEPGVRRPESATTEVERAKVIFEVNVQPFTARRASLHNGRIWPCVARWPRPRRLIEVWPAWRGDPAGERAGTGRQARQCAGHHVDGRLQGTAGGGQECASVWRAGQTPKKPSRSGRTRVPTRARTRARTPARPRLPLRAGP